MALIRQSILAATSAVVLTISRFALMAILSRRLPIAAFGQVAFAQWLLDITLLFCSFGAMAVASRYFAEFSGRPNLLAIVARRWLPYAIGLPLLASAVTVSVDEWTRPQATFAEAASLGLWAATNGLWAMRTAGLMGLQRFDLVLAGNLVSGLAMLAGAAFMPSSALGLAGIFVLMALANLVGALSSFGAFATAFTGTGSMEGGIDYRGIGRYAVNMWLTAILWNLVWSRGEWPFVKGFVGDAGVAHYAAATTLFGGAIQGVMLSVAGIAPHLTRLWGDGRIDVALALARRIMDMQLLLAGGAAILLLAFGPWLLQVCFGLSFREGAQALAVLSLGVPTLAWSTHNYLLQLRTHARFNRDSTLVGLVILYALSAWLVPSSGISGAALSRAITMWLMASISLAFAVRTWGMRVVPWRNLSWTIAILATVLTGVTEWPAITLGTRLVLAGAASALLFGALRDADGLPAWAWGTLLVRRRHLSVTTPDKEPFT